MTREYMSNTPDCQDLPPFFSSLRFLCTDFAFGILVSDLLVRLLPMSGLSHAALTSIATTQRLGRRQRSPCLIHYSLTRRLVVHECERRLQQLWEFLLLQPIA